VALGIGVGGVIWAAAALFGLALLFEYAPILLTAFKVAGGAFLIYMAFKLWRMADIPLNEVPGNANPHSYYSAFLLGLFTQVSNPKPAILFAAIFIGTVPTTAGWPVYIALMTAVFINETLWNMLISRLFSLPKARSAYINLKGWMDRIFGTLLAVLGVKIAIT